MKTFSLKFLKRIMAAVALLSCMTACNHKNLDDIPEPDLRIRVKFDWSHATKAEPQWMQVFFYNTVTGMMVYEVYPADEGGYAELEPGEWEVATYNLDDNSNILQDHTSSFSTHHISTRAGNILEGALGNTQQATTDEEQPVMITPDMVWGEARESLIINPEPGQREFVVTLFPEELVCHYSFEIRNVENLGHITNMCGALSGMSGGLTFSTSSVDEESVILPLSAAADGSKTIRGEFYTFGVHPENHDPKKMRLYVWLDDGRKLVFGTSPEGSAKWDVSDQILNAADPRRVHYVIDGLDIPSSMEGGLFDPSADDWWSENYEIGI